MTTGKNVEDLSDAAHTLMTFDAISLNDLGVHILANDIDEIVSKEVMGFIVKSNLFFDDRTLTLMINSNGGSVADGFSIIDVMTTSRLPVRTVGIGMIASMALLILCAGSKGLRTVTKNTDIMAHQFAMYIGGKHHELIAAQVAYERLEHQFIKHFKQHSTMTEKQIRDVLFSASDRYLEPKELLKFGLVDNVVDYFVDIPSKQKKKGRI